MKAASSMARSTKNLFAMFGLFGSVSVSFRAARIVAANRMANFLSSVTLELLNSVGRNSGREKRATAVYFILVPQIHVHLNLKTAWLENQARSLFSPHSADAIQYGGNVGA